MVWQCMKYLGLPCSKPNALLHGTEHIWHTLLIIIHTTRIMIQDKRCFRNTITET